MNEDAQANPPDDSLGRNPEENQTMKYLTPAVLAALLASLSPLTFAQSPGGGGPGNRGNQGPGQGGPEGGHRPPPSPLFEALDLDHDGVISAAELAKAAESLKKLDRNGDGQLTHDEVRPPRPEGERGGERQGPGGPQNQGGAGGSEPRPQGPNGRP